MSLFRAFPFRFEMEARRQHINEVGEHGSGAVEVKDQQSDVVLLALLT
jgi:hypothetical protein